MKKSSVGEAVTTVMLPSADQNQVSQASISTIQQIYGQKLGVKIPIDSIMTGGLSVVASPSNSMTPNTPQSRMPTSNKISRGCIGTKHASVVVESSTASPKRRYASPGRGAKLPALSSQRADKICIIAQDGDESNDNCLRLSKQLRKDDSS